MTERVKMKYVSCLACGKQLFKVSGNCSVEMPEGDSRGS